MKMSWLKFVLGLLVLVLVLVLISPLWIGPVVRTGANTAVPMKTKTQFNLGAFSLNGYTGHLELGDMQLYNPEGFDQRLAVTLGQLSVDVDPLSLVSDVIVVRNIELKDLFVAYVFDGSGHSNFDRIMKNVNGEAEPVPGDEPSAASDSVGVSVSKDAKASSPSSVKQTATKPEEKKSESGSRKRIIIDRLRISGVLVQVGKLTIPMPAFTLTGIGRKTNGILPEDAWKEILAKFQRSMGVVGTGLLDLSSGAKTKALELGGLGKEQTDRAVKAIKDLKLQDSVKSVGEGADTAIKALKGLLK